MKSNHYGLIMAGGRGTRFWPRSRRRTAKQVLRFMGDVATRSAFRAGVSPSPLTNDQ